MAVERRKDIDQYSFRDIELKAMGTGKKDIITTLQSISYSTTQDKGYTYGTDSKGDPRSIQRGNRSHGGNFVILQSDLEKLITEDVLDGYFNITVTYDNGSGVIVTDKINDVQVMGFDKTISQGDFNTTHSLDFIALNIVYGSAP